MQVGGIIIAVAGLVILAVAVLSWRRRLPRNSFVGVRTLGTMRSDEAFRTANKVAAPLEAAGGIVMIVGGVVAAAVPFRAEKTGLAAAVVGVALIAIGAVQGVRAARAAR